MATKEAKCPRIEGCRMYRLFSYSGTKVVWQNLYCLSDFLRCERYKLVLQKQEVPDNLMPNGELLKT